MSLCSLHTSRPFAGLACPAPSRLTASIRSVLRAAILEAGKRWVLAAGLRFSGAECRERGMERGAEPPLAVQGRAAAVAAGKAAVAGGGARTQDVGRSLSPGAERYGGVSAVGGSGKRSERAWR